MENADALNRAPDSEFDFDAMFGDSVMDTSGDGGHDSAELDLVDGDDLGFTLDDQPEQPDLLRGLEDFAKGDAEDTPGQNNASTLDLDFNMTDMPDLNNNPPPEQPAVTKVETPAAQPPAVTAAAAAPATTTDDLNLETMNTDNIDDLFDLDYENPEATQFDDAFFGFDDN